VPGIAGAVRVHVAGPLGRRSSTVEKHQQRRAAFRVRYRRACGCCTPKVEFDLEPRDPLSDQTDISTLLVSGWRVTNGGGRCTRWSAVVDHAFGQSTESDGAVPGPQLDCGARAFWRQVDPDTGIVSGPFLLRWSGCGRFRSWKFWILRPLSHPSYRLHIRAVNLD